MDLSASLPPGLSGLQQLHAMIASGGLAPIGATLGFTLVDAEPGRVVFEGTPGLHTLQSGRVPCMADGLPPCSIPPCFCAVLSQLSPTQAHTTLELKVAYHKAITAASGMMRAVGTVLTPRPPRRLHRSTPYRRNWPVACVGHVHAAHTRSLAVCWFFSTRIAALRFHSLPIHVAWHAYMPGCRPRAMAGLHVPIRWWRRCRKYCSTCTRTALVRPPGAALRSTCLISSRSSSPSRRQISRRASQTSGSSRMLVLPAPAVMFLLTSRLPPKISGSTTPLSLQS